MAAHCRFGKRLVVVAVLLSAFAFLKTSRAQQAKPPTLDEILERLEVNLQSYKSTVPSFFCDEHLVSRMSPPWQETVTDSTFRLRRVVVSDDALPLVASRDVKSVDGYAEAGEVLRGPAIVSGAFSGGYAVV